MPALVDKLLIANLGSVIGCSSNPSTLQWTGTFVMFKASLEGWMNGCRPILGLDGCLMKGKYGGVCLSIIGLDGNYGLFPIAAYLCRMCVLVPMRRPWKKYCSKYYWVSSYVATYADAIYTIEDESSWGKPPREVRPPPLIRQAGRPRKQRRKDADELNGNGGERKCGKCRMFGHNKKTCKGPPTLPQTPIRRPISRQDTPLSQREVRASMGFNITNDEPMSTGGGSTIRGGGRSGRRGSSRSSAAVGGRSSAAAGGRSSAAVGGRSSASGRSSATAGGRSSIGSRSSATAGDRSSAATGGRSSAGDRLSISIGGRSSAAAGDRSSAGGRSSNSHIMLLLVNGLNVVKVVAQGVQLMHIPVRPINQKTAVPTQSSQTHVVPPENP
ncbi:hypothetical protein GIB67_040618 [Kingdonia uniflora]|uniref:Uncharacterized protein n=1 Tax=Kingdonia uniflora TaxID=39325 RepID=A0A7J7M8Y8_9MAGN|nr:hypothetical protein GIB67_040618 [Kingdonia uniflora]